MELERLLTEGIEHLQEVFAVEFICNSKRPKGSRRDRGLIDRGLQKLPNPNLNTIQILSSRNALPSSSIPGKSNKFSPINDFREQLS